MKVAVFSSKPYDVKFLRAANQSTHQLQFIEARLTADTTILAEGFDAICAFVNDHLDKEILQKLKALGVRLIALRCAGFNQVDLAEAQRLGLCVVRVPAYSPHAVAEHTIGLILALNRQLYRAYNRVREGNFLIEGLMGFDLHGKTVGVIGTGKIGRIAAQILAAFGCRVLAYDTYQDPELIKANITYLPLEEIFKQSDIITLHSPLTPETHHIIRASSIQQMKPGVMLINTSRGALIHTGDIIEGLKMGRIGYLGLDVYEEEGDIFFEDLSNRVIQDDNFSRLLTFPNVLITGHQAFFTQEAMENISSTTIANISEFEKTGACKNKV